ncbi:MAG: hypothetical protein Q8K00_04090 [Syntrophales bacterium]|nr:hypothetical protein [Syntrophales bacterium]
MTMRTLALKELSVFFICVSLSACGLSWIAEPKTNPVIEDRVGIHGQQPVGTLATTAERRIVLVKIAKKDPKFGYFCAEPPPDAAENIANSLALAVEAIAKTPEVEASGRVELTKQLVTNVQSLFHRSQGLQLYRDGMYNLCQNYLNDLICKDEFNKSADKLLEMSNKLILKELTLTQGIIGGPPPTPPAILQLDNTGLPSERLRLLQSHRIRAFRLVTGLANAKKQRDETKAKVVLVELHDILVSDAMLDSNSPQRTMGDDELKGMLDRLRPLAKKDFQDKLVLPAQLKVFKDKREDFQQLFIPFPSP